MKPQSQEKKNARLTTTGLSVAGFLPSLRRRFQHLLQPCPAGFEANLHLAAGEVFLRPPAPEDAQAWVGSMQRSEDFLRRWSPRQNLQRLTLAGYARRLKRWDAERAEGQALPLFIFSASGSRFLGGINIANIVRGAGQMATLGYWLDSHETGRGYMTAALGAACAHAFGPLRLHRLQAGCLAENTASRRVLQNAGFLPEGIARQYICIDGVWRDHLIFARIADDAVVEG